MKLIKTLLLGLSLLGLTACGNTTAEDYAKKIGVYNEPRDTGNGVIQYSKYYYISKVIYKSGTLTVLTEDGDVFYNITNGYNVHISKQYKKDLFVATYQTNIMDRTVFENLFITVKTYHKLVEDYNFVLYGNRTI